MVLKLNFIEIPKDAILKQATISRTNNQYFISILVDDNIPIPKPIKAKMQLV